MIEAFGAEAVRAAEEPLLAAERGFAGGLMDRAAMALAGQVLAVLRERRGRHGAGGVAGARVVGLVGAGNNGGDALHALARLARRGVAVEAFLLADAAHPGGLAALRSAGCRVLRLTDDVAPAVERALASDVLLDGLLGIGARGALRGTAAELVTHLTGALAARAAAARPVVVAVDAPSGIGVGDGTVPGPVLPADLTVTFGVAKPGLLLPPAAHRAGRVRVVDLGLRPVLTAHGATPVAARLTDADVAALWPVPTPADHKYARGVLGVLAGSRAYPGAAVLTVGGAVGAGVGMVRHVGRRRVGAAVLAAHPEALVGQATSDRVQAWVAGPGLVIDADDAATSRPAAAGVALAAVPDDTAPSAGVAADAPRAAGATSAVVGGPGLDRGVARFAAILAAGVPTVLDAGALDAVPALLADRATPFPPSVVLTPHAGELARLLTALAAATTREQVEAEPLRHARAAHAATGATVLLKGAVTVVVGHETYAQADAPPWLATAGAGDVLAGVLGALLAGRPDVADPAAPARLAAAAALVHGRAAHLANPDGPVGASAVAAAVPRAVAQVLS